MMKSKPIKLISILLVILVITLACSLIPVMEKPQTELPQAPNSQPTAMPELSVPAESTALPNDSGIEGVQTYPDRVEYHDHVEFVPVPTGDLPPVFGAHLAAWQNCGLYDQPVELGSALHSMEHGAVWLTYRPALPKDQVTELQNLVRGHDYVLMSPYPAQKSDVVLTAWGVQLVIDSYPDKRVAPFIKFYENGPQNYEPGAPCSGGVGTPIK
jgi:hypothetical protein